MDLLDGADGELISRAKAARTLPGRGANNPSPSCMGRWIKHGVTGVDGKRHRLEAVQVGSYWKTTAAAVRRFVRATSGLPSATDSPARAASEPRSPAEGRRGSDTAAAELEAMGV